MKKTLASLCVALLLTGTCIRCDKEDENKTLRLTVASERIYVTEPAGNVDILALLVLYPGETHWRHFSESIDGFDRQYRTGYEYVIDMEVIPVKNPPMDAGSERYRLKRIVSRIAKQSENLPENSVRE